MTTAICLMSFWEDLNFQLEQERGAVFHLVGYYEAIKNDVGVEF